MENPMASDQVAVSRKQIGGEAPMVVSKVTEDCLYTGLFGSLDSARMAVVTNKLTSLAEAAQISMVIIDLGNVDTIDSAVSSELVRLGDTLAMVGVAPIYCGIKGVLARTMVSAGVNLGQYIVSRDFKSALSMSYQRTGYRLIKLSDTEAKTVLASDI
jgi:rsbT co-antagonist protein RsbR